MQELTATKTLKVMTIGEAQREQYRSVAARIQQEGPAIIKGIKTKEGADKAAAWRVDVREFIRSIEAGPLGMASADLLRLKREIDAEMDLYIDPCKKLSNEAKAKGDRWVLEEEQRVKLLNAKLNAKAEEKAVKKQEQVVQTLMDLGKHKAAKTVLRQPLVYAPVVVEMPKVNNTIMKTIYAVTIEDMGELLAYIAERPQYHDWIDQDVLLGKLKAQAVQLAGNMQDFPGIKCTQSKTSALVGGPK
jgi:hypothetical protein